MDRPSPRCHTRARRHHAPLNKGTSAMNQFDLSPWSDWAPRLLALIPALILILFGALGARILLRRSLDTLVTHTRLTPRDAAPIKRVVNWIVTVLALVLVLNVVGVNLGGLWTVFSTVLAMVAIGFVAVWSVLSNTLCTLVIMIARPFAVGDDVEFPGDPIKGRVIDLNFIFTTLATEDGAEIRVPNNLFFQKALKCRRSADSDASSLADRLKRPQAA
ncbi:MAG: mechanosensitive ion channel family protein [Opitutus sp.]|nr:mechanosensitive ion channel family protein [Opitutus sp.]